MTSDLCSEDVVVHIATPQIISGEGGSRAGGATGASAELGRRLLVAARAGDTAQVLELMAAGAPFTTDWLGTSPLHLAAAHAHADTCAVLLRAGVSRDARTKVERTPLQLAAAGGHAAAARVLLAAGADVHCRDMLHMTALHWAAARGHAAAARALLAAGADPLARSKFRKTPLQLARASRQPELVRLLEDGVRQREAQRSVDALVIEEMTEEAPSEPETRLFETVQRIEVIPPHTQAETTKTKTQPEKPDKTENPKTETKESSSSAAAQLLRQHGITLLPTDDGSTVLSALQSGRTVVLSDAGKLMLKESGEPPPAAKPPILVKLPATAKTPQTGKSPVVLTATPVTSPPRGVKVFTLNNKLVAAPRVARDLQQVKIVQLPSDAKLRCPSRVVPMKARNRATPVRIVVSRADLPQLSPTPSAQAQGQAQAQPDAAEQSEQPAEPAALRAALAQAQRTVAALRGQLLVARAKLARYEGDER